jgi:hypothetical protein
VGTSTASSKIGLGARAAGMGGAYVALADDPTAVYWNPAGIARLVEDKTEVMVAHVEWPSDVNVDNAAIVFHFKKLPGALAVNARSLTIADEPVRDSFRPDGTGEFFDAGYASFGATYARSFTDKILGGVRSAWSASVWPRILAVHGHVRPGHALRRRRRRHEDRFHPSIGGQVQFIDREARIPTVFRVGTSAADLIKNGTSHLIGSFEFSHPPDNAERLNLGAEYGFKDYLFLRMGNNFNYDSEGFAAGAGVRFPISAIKTNANFDYAYTDMKTLGASHRLSLRVRF